MVTKTSAVSTMTVKRKVAGISVTGRTYDLHGKAIGFLWNSKSNGDILLLRIQERLSQKYRFTQMNWHQKPSAGASASRAIIEELMTTSDLVITAIGD